MLYKVTPMLPSAEEKPRKVREPGQPRKRRKTAIYDGDGHEVLITLMCLKCKGMKPLAQFGLRKMPDGAIRNQPWCRTCRGAAGTKKDKPREELAVVTDPHNALPASEPLHAELPAPQYVAEPSPVEAAPVAASVVEVSFAEVLDRSDEPVTDPLAPSLQSLVPDPTPDPM